ncbi:hypothetical protein NKG05_00235 [Oerskovia sp. M15]
MIATTLRSAGLDPSFAIGGSVITSDGRSPVGGSARATSWSRRPTSPTARSSTTPRRSPSS